MQEENNMLLQAILGEQRAIRNEVTDLNQTVATKNDLNNYRIEMKMHFDDIKKTSEDQEKEISFLKNSDAENTKFRKGFIGTIRYVGGAIFVAILGIASTLAPAYIQKAITPVANYSTPISTPTPLEKVHLRFP